MLQEPVTNNHLEGFHTKLNKWSQKAHPDVNSLINLFKLFDSKVADVFSKRKKVNKPPARDKKMLQKYEKLQELLKNLRKNDIDLSE
jgi:hypothetical protein